MTKDLHVNEIRRVQPRHENSCEHNAEAADRPERRSTYDLKCAHWRYVETLFPAAAQFVETDSDERPEQCEARYHRIEQRQDLVAKRKPEENQAGDRIDEADEERVCWYRAKVVVALGELLPRRRWS